MRFDLRKDCTMSRIRFGVWAAMALVLVPLAGAQSYTVTDLGVLSDSTYCGAQAINDRGAVVGSCIVANQNQGFLWTPTAGMQALGALPGDTGSIAIALNNSNEVVGESLSSSDARRAFFWSAATGMRRLPPAGPSVSAADGINDSGVIVGVYYPVNVLNPRAALWPKDGGMIDLGTLGGSISAAAAINNAGEVVGYSSTSNSRDATTPAFLWSQAGGMQSLGTLGGPIGEAYAINDSGEVFGGSETSTGELVDAFFWTPGTGMELLAGAGYGSRILSANDSGQLVGAFDEYDAPLLWTAAQGAQNLNDLIPPNSGWLLYVANGINRAGQIVAYGKINGETHAALLTPVN
jgi:probable HAF family extracellular repeat protein